MAVSVSIGLPLVLGVVLIVSAVQKLRHPEDAASWAALGVPSWLRRPLIIRAHPWGELVLGVALIGTGAWLGLVFALAALALMLAYTVLIVRSLRQPGEQSCACFGSEATITPTTAWRNGWLAAIAGVAAIGIAGHPLWGGALARATELGLTAWGWILVGAASALTAALIVGSSALATRAPSGSGAESLVADDSAQEYIRHPTPAIPLTLGDGSPVTLRQLSLARPVLILAVSETCGACLEVIEQVDAWRSLLPVVDVRLLVERDPEGSGLTSRDEPQSLHDPQALVRQSLNLRGTPSAVLLGADGQLAGGPVAGSEAVATFVDDIHAELTDAGVLPG